MRLVCVDTVRAGAVRRAFTKMRSIQSGAMTPTPSVTHTHTLTHTHTQMSVTHIHTSLTHTHTHTHTHTNVAYTHTHTRHTHKHTHTHTHAIQNHSPSHTTRTQCCWMRLRTPDSSALSEAHKPRGAGNKHRRRYQRCVIDPPSQPRTDASITSYAKPINNNDFSEKLIY